MPPSHLLLLKASTSPALCRLRGSERSKVKGTKSQPHTHKERAHTHTHAACQQQVILVLLCSSLGRSNLITRHTELSWCKLACFLCFPVLYLLWEGLCGVGQQVVKNLGVKGRVSACFPAYQLLSFRLNRPINFRFEVTFGCDQDHSLSLVSRLLW